ncbi:MAG: T9SS type A sorting domain-containing protein [Flavobacteriales bacterium]|nr:T9SS type A sorting domain-containing protein [Flavobacteriales bacterium]MBL0043428.1 T9SS type A sorting domain-containing protein [Flavobacteriales bacterium]
MRHAFLVTLFVVEALAFGQGFNKRYDALSLGRAQGGWDVEKRDPGWMVTSVSSDVDSLGPDSFLTHYSVVLAAVDPSGIMQSEVRTYRAGHGTTSGWANCTDKLNDGYVIGGASESVQGVLEIYLMRFNDLGDTLWTRVFGDSQLNVYWISYAVRVNSAGGFNLAGTTDTNGSRQGFVLQTDGQGNEQWRHTYGYSGPLDDGFLSIDRGPSGSFYCSGTSETTSGNGDHYVARIDIAGNLLWQTRWGGSWSEGATQIITLLDGQALVSSGNANAAGSQQMRPLLAKLDSTDGSVIWQQEYGPETFSTTFFAAKERPNGDLIACGVSYYGGDQQGLLLRTTSEGDSIWMRSYFYQDTLMTDGRGRFYDVLPTDDGGFIAAGAAYQSGTIGYPAGYSQDTWVVKVDSMGCILPGCDATGVTEVITNMQNALTVFPNPAHGVVSVGITLPPALRNAQALKLTLVNTAGHVALVREAQEGSNELDLGSLASGLYYVHLSNEKTWISGSKLIIE